MKFWTPTLSLIAVITMTWMGFAGTASADNSKIIASCKDAYGEVYVEQYVDPLVWDGTTMYKVGITSTDAAQWFKSHGFKGSDEIENPNVMLMAGMYTVVKNKWYEARRTIPVEGIVDADGSSVKSIETNYTVRLNREDGEVTVSGLSFNNRINVVPIQTKAADINWIFKNCQFDVGNSR